MDCEKQKVVIIIPAYQPPKAFVSYARELLAKKEVSLLVVDDGSGEEYVAVFSAVSSLPRTTVLTHNENKGKGAALKSAFRFSLAENGENTLYAVADCDGQHRVKDVFRVLNAVKAHPFALVLGVRDFKGASVPRRSRLGNTAMIKILERFCGISLADTQTGLRGFSHALLPYLLEVEGNRFAYETRVLLHLHEKGFLLHQVEIETVYRERREGEGRVSHFRPLRDSLDVLGVFFSSFGIYFLSSVVSALLDVFLFYLFSRFVFVGIPEALCLLWAALLARISSSVVNFLGNRLAFRGEGKKSLLRYYILWTVQLSVSYGLTLLLGRFIPTGLWLSLAKGLVDLALAFFSYHIQKRWVFAPKQSKKYAFYGPFFCVARFLVRPFLKQYKANLFPPEAPTVYVSRHLNMHGPVTLAAFMPFDTHFFGLDCFFRFSTCFKQYKDYTFTARYSESRLRRIFGTVAAFFAALVVPPLLRSMKMIAVYRGKDMRSISCLRKALSCLEKGESVTVFADVDYALTDKSNQKIYNGFLLLDKMYCKKTGKHLSFCVLDYDEENHRIVKKRECAFVDGESGEEGLLRLTEEITEALFDGESKKKRKRQRADRKKRPFARYS